MSRNRLAIYVDFYQGGIGKRFKVGAKKRQHPNRMLSLIKPISCLLLFNYLLPADHLLSADHFQDINT